MSYEPLIKDHYAKESSVTGDGADSTMRDLTIREAELKALIHCIRKIRENSPSRLKILEIGSGNGYALSHLSQVFPDQDFSGIEFTPELLAIAHKRNLAKVVFKQGDVRKLEAEDNTHDIVFTERVIINLMDRKDQYQAIREIARVLKKGGYFLMIEGFEEPLQNLNEARKEMGLDAIPTAHHNLNFSEEVLVEAAKAGFEAVDFGIPYNFLSTHYFVARVLHASLKPENGPIHNTHFVRFFNQGLPPNIGNYGTIQFRAFKKK